MIQASTEKLIILYFPFGAAGGITPKPNINMPTSRKTDGESKSQNIASFGFSPAACFLPGLHFTLHQVIKGKKWMPTPYDTVGQVHDPAALGRGPCPHNEPSRNRTSRSKLQRFADEISPQSLRHLYFYPPP